MAARSKRQRKPRAVRAWLVEHEDGIWFGPPHCVTARVFKSRGRARRWVADVGEPNTVRRVTITIEEEGK